MSHYVVHVLVPSDISETGPELNSYLDGVLARYDENRAVEPYIDELYTPEKIAEARASKYANGIRHLPDPEFLLKWTGRKVTPDPEGNGYHTWTTYNTDSKWDWWCIGGRWSGYFDGTDEVTVAQALKHFADKTEKLRVEAEMSYDAFEKATAGMTRTTMREILEKNARHYPDEDENRRVSREEYQELEWVQAADAVRESTIFSPLHEHYFCLETGGRETFVAENSVADVVPYAMIDLFGNWVAKGEMGWFGMSNDKESTADWAAKYFETLANAPLNARIVSLDLHI